MKILTPLAIALLGLGAGLGAGFALKPAPEAAADAAASCAEASDGAESDEASDGAESAEDCPAVEVDPFQPAPPVPHAQVGEAAIVALDKPLVVPVFSGERVVAMVVVSVALDIAVAAETGVKAAEPRLRDSFLEVMFRHANSGGFDGAFTAGRKMEDLRSALLVAAREIFTGVAVSEVLITAIARQDT